MTEEAKRAIAVCLSIAEASHEPAVRVEAAATVLQHMRHVAEMDEVATANKNLAGLTNRVAHAEADAAAIRAEINDLNSRLRGAR